MKSGIRLIYLACPFRHPDPKIQQKRCSAAHYTAAQLILQGNHVFSPLTHNDRLIEISGDAIPKEHWMEFDLAVLSICHSLYLLKMEGWEQSKGVQREIRFAKEQAISIRELDPPDETLFNAIPCCL